jgi:hypothetical protein
MQSPSGTGLSQEGLQALVNLTLFLGKIPSLDVAMDHPAIISGSFRDWTRNCESRSNRDIRRGKKLIRLMDTTQEEMDAVEFGEDN